MRRYPSRSVATSQGEGSIKAMTITACLGGGGSNVYAGDWYLGLVPSGRYGTCATGNALLVMWVE